MADMALRFGEKQAVDSLDGLDAVARAQLERAGKLYDGEDLPVEQRLADDGEETSWKGFLYHAPIFDGDTKVYDAWFMMVDSGSFFRAGTAEEVAGIIQFGLECEDPALRDELGKAMVAAQLLPPQDGSYARFKALLDAGGPS